MHISSLFILAVGLSMDAFAVSLCKGMAVKRASLRHGLCCGLYFGAFQMLMPMLGWLAGVRFQDAIQAVDHWIAFCLLVFLGVKMAREGCAGQDESYDASFAPKSMLPLAIATSIDALAAGVTFALLQGSILPAVSLIGAITFLFCTAGVLLGARFGAMLGKWAQYFGAAVLILMGCKILIEHLGLFG